MRYDITVTIPFLPKMINGMSRSWWLINQQRREIKALVLEQVEDHLPAEPLKKAKLECVRYSSATPDFDGLVSGFKAAIDGLTEAGVIEDDNMNVIGMPEFRWEKAKQGEGKITVRVQSV